MSKFDQRNQKVDKQINADKVSIGTKPITCPQCQCENPPKARFCSECGASLVFKCPVCNSETPLGSKFCSGCGKAISSIERDIEIAQKAGGVLKELSYTWRTRYDTHTVRETLAIDEYVLLKESGVYLFKDDIPDANGDLYLTNRRLLILGYEVNMNVLWVNYSYPLKDISHVEMKTETFLFFTKHYLRIITEGRLRKFNLPEREAKIWADTVLRQTLQNK